MWKCSWISKSGRGQFLICTAIVHFPLKCQQILKLTFNKSFPTNWPFLHWNLRPPQGQLRIHSAAPAFTHIYRCCSWIFLASIDDHSESSVKANGWQHCACVLAHLTDPVFVISVWVAFVYMNKRSWKSVIFPILFPAFSGKFSELSLSLENNLHYKHLWSPTYCSRTCSGWAGRLNRGCSFGKSLHFS